MEATSADIAALAAAFPAVGTDGTAVAVSAASAIGAECGIIRAVGTGRTAVGAYDFALRTMEAGSAIIPCFALAAVFPAAGTYGFTVAFSAASAICAEHGIIRTISAVSVALNAYNFALRTIETGSAIIPCFALTAVFPATGTYSVAVAFSAAFTIDTEFGIICTLEAGFATVTADDFGAIGTRAAVSALITRTIGTFTAFRAGVIVGAVATHSAFFADQIIIPMVTTAYRAVHTILIVRECRRRHERQTQHEAEKKADDPFFHFEFLLNEMFFCFLRQSSVPYTLQNEHTLVSICII